MNQITTQRELRRLFWETFPELDRRKVSGDYKTDTRVAFIEWIDTLQRDGSISESLAQRATL